MARIVKTITSDLTEKVLGQATPSDTNAVSIYSPASPVVSTEITSIFICNTDSSQHSYRIFLDDDGTTYNTTTALFYDKTINGNETSIPLSGTSVFMNNLSGNLAVRTNSANNLTFTVLGIELKGNL